MKDPQSYVRSLALTASAVTAEKSIPIRRYFRSGAEMLRMAKMYADEGELENAFILYTKYTTLFVEQIPKHPEYSLLSDAEKYETKKKLQSIFVKAEEVKAALSSNYKLKYEVWKQQKEKEEAEELQRKLKQLEEEEAKEKIRRIREEYEQEKNWRVAQGKELLKEVNMEETPDVEDVCDVRSNSTSSNLSLISPTPSLYSQISEIPYIDSSRPSSTPSVDRSTKPRSLLTPGPDLAYIHGLRIVIMPSSGIEKFLKLALSNTLKNIETCGILAGKITHSQLIVTHLLIPKQTGTPDSCTTDNEEDLFIYQDEYDLITLGWIHTHPSQTAFMSSVDLHTHCSYQLMMPEAIAIVCSPKYEKTCIFSLTPDYGVDYISQCRQKGFHPHPNEPTIYEESVHVILDNNMSLSVVDLRK